MRENVFILNWRDLNCELKKIMKQKLYLSKKENDLQTLGLTHRMRKRK